MRSPPTASRRTSSPCPKRSASTQKLDYVGGLAYLGALVQNVPTAANIRHYAHIVRDRSILRQLAATAGEIADTAYNPLGRSAKRCSTRRRRRCCTSPSRARAARSSSRSIGKLLASVVERIETLYNRDDPSDVTGVPTGFADLDRMTSGLAAGRSRRRRRAAERWARRALALNIGEHVALERRSMPVAVFSMEMGASQLALRHDRLGRHASTSTSCGPAASPPRTGRSFRPRSAGFNEAPILIDETPALNAIEVRSRARRLMKQYGKLGLVIVDYLQLMQATTAGENRATEISEISRAMKSLAKELQGAGRSRCRSSTARSSSGRTSGP